MIGTNWEKGNKIWEGGHIHDVDTRDTGIF